MKIGIYKITNPKNKIYIGQTNSFDRRLNEYKRLDCKNQRKLYNSLKKYGIDNHKFELIEECNFEFLNERERYWQDFYNVINCGLNLKLINSNLKKSVVSNETKNKIRNTLKNYFKSLSLDEKIKIYGKSGKKRKGKIGNRRGCVLTKEHIKKVIESRKWYKHSDDTKNKIRKKMIGRNVTWGEKISKANKGKTRNKGFGCKEILQYTKNGELLNEWKSITEASNATGIGFNSISNNLTGRTKITGGFKWKYK